MTPPLGDKSSGAQAIALPRNCTLEAEDWKILAAHWYPIALVRDLGSRPLSAKLLDEPLVIYL